LCGSWVATPLLGLCLLTALSGCFGKPAVSVVIPDDRELGPVIACTWEDGEIVSCTEDTTRVSISIGYFREIMELLDDCRGKPVASDCGTDATCAKWAYPFEYM